MTIITPNQPVIKHGHTWVDMKDEHGVLMLTVCSKCGVKKTKEYSKK